MIREELGRMTTWEQRHRLLIARLLIVLISTALIDVAGTLAIYFLERHARGSEVHTIGDALFFTTVQLLTVSSQLRNPVTPWGRVVDVGLEFWAVIVVAGSAGAVTSFFQAADTQGSNSS